MSLKKADPISRPSLKRPLQYPLKLTCKQSCPTFKGEGASMTLKSSRNLLTLVWVIGFLPPFLILAARTYVGTYYEKAEEAWSWFTPNIIPTLGLIIGTLASSAVGKQMEEKIVEPFFFKLTLALSILYLTIFNLIFILEPLSDSDSPLETLTRSSLFLGIAQGLVTSALGAFFVRSAEKDK
jgi:hypothetical protein